MNHLLDVSFTDANTGTAVGYGGTILRTTSGGATWVEDEKANPAAFQLAQNYPNPVLGTTIIPFSITRPAHVSLTVYNILGKKVVVLLDSEQMAGSHSIPFNSSGLVSGMYFYVIRTGMTVETRNMLVINP
jgi:pectate lyase